MDMEQRKVAWANRINLINPHINIIDVRRLVSICQDAFNEGHKAGQKEANLQQFGKEWSENHD